MQAVFIVCKKVILVRYVLEKRIKIVDDNEVIFKLLVVLVWDRICHIYLEINRLAVLELMVPRLLVPRQLLVQIVQQRHLLRMLQVQLQQLLQHRHQLVLDRPIWLRALLRFRN